MILTQKAMDNAISFFGFITAEAKRVLFNNGPIFVAFVSLKFTRDATEVGDIGLFAKIIEG